MISKSLGENAIKEPIKNPNHTFFFLKYQNTNPTKPKKNNIFQYSLLGHEIGHIYADKLLKKIKLKSSLKSLLKKYLRSPSIKDIPKFIDDCTSVWKRLFGELMSDAVGTVLFGPAMVFSIS